MLKSRLENTLRELVSILTDHESVMYNYDHCEQIPEILQAKINVQFKIDALKVGINSFRNDKSNIVVTDEMKKSIQNLIKINQEALYFRMLFTKSPNKNHYEFKIEALQNILDVWAE